jgi:2-aminoadipate transaminase
MRIALAIAPKPIIDKFVIAKQVSDIHSSLWSQRVMAKFLQDYDIDEHIRGLRKLYKHKCDLMIGEMEKYFHPSVKYIKPTGGMFIWVTLPESMEVMSFINEALKRGVAVVPGSAFSIDDTATTHNIRLNFSTPSDQDIVKGIQILGKLTYEMK